MTATRLLVLLLVSCPATLALAEIRLPAIFSDHMVVQRDAALKVWGWADPGEAVTVNLATQRRTTHADDAGRWLAQLDPLERSENPLEMTVSAAGENSLNVRDILVGEVWLCSGQSNMEWPVTHANNASSEIAAAHHPNIRMFRVDQSARAQPAPDCSGSWVVCTTQTAGGFSAVGYFFGRDLHKSLHVPVGLINSSFGGATLEAWMDRGTLGEFPEMKPRVQDLGAELNQYVPTALYNPMIAPIIGYTIRGTIWYQGESNVANAWRYRERFPAMIRSWRECWGQGDFPFLFVQLANYGDVLPEPAESEWAELREAQAMALSLPNTAMAVALDIGDAANIHPPNKQETARRLALAARAVAYGKKVVYQGPTYEAMSVEGSSIRVKFRNTEGRLIARGDRVTGFAIAGDDKKFVWADATIDGDIVIVSSKLIPNPVAVRYGWASNPRCNLYNSADLPASPFRTDDWPGITVGKD